MYNAYDFWAWCGEVAGRDQRDKQERDGVKF